MGFFRSHGLGHDNEGCHFASVIRTDEGYTMYKIMTSIRDKDLSFRGGDNLSVQDRLNIQLQSLNTVMGIMANKEEDYAFLDFKINGFWISRNNGPIRFIINLQEAIVIYDNQNNYPWEKDMRSQENELATEFVKLNNIVFTNVSDQLYVLLGLNKDDRAELFFAKYFFL